MWQSVGRFPYLPVGSLLTCDHYSADSAGEVSTTILLPKAVKGLRELERSLSVELLQRYAKSASGTLMKVLIPRLTMTYGVNLEKVLERMGMGAAFDANRADFDESRTYAVGATGGLRAV